MKIRELIAHRTSFGIHPTAQIMSLVLMVPDLALWALNAGYSLDKWLLASWAEDGRGSRHEGQHAGKFFRREKHGRLVVDSYLIPILEDKNSCL
jgi:hypothetical protein